MTPEEFTTKIEDLRTLLAEKAAELEENPKWGSADEREQIVNALDELVVQAEALRETLEEEVEDGEEPDGED